jgi:hypothetical protein
MYSIMYNECKDILLREPKICFELESFLSKKNCISREADRKAEQTFREASYS